MDKYYSVSKNHEKEVVIERSRFIAACAPVKTEEEAKAFVYAVKKKHSAATHNCYAYITELGKYSKFSDDGEPGGTAGAPILEAIKNLNLTDTAVVVTRYFGGIKLGAGGLTRAYGSVAAAALKECGVKTYVLSSFCRVSLDYEAYQKFLRFASVNALSVLKTEFSDGVSVEFSVEKSAYKSFIDKFCDYFSGKVAVENIGEDFAETRGEKQ